MTNKFPEEEEEEEEEKILYEMISEITQNSQKYEAKQSKKEEKNGDGLKTMKVKIFPTAKQILKQ